VANWTTPLAALQNTRIRASEILLAASQAVPVVDTPETNPENRQDKQDGVSFRADRERAVNAQQTDPLLGSP
jgi:hypothetical protein